MQAWRLKAACVDKDPNLFYPSSNASRQTNAAKAFCRGCVCRIDCLNYALENKEEFGIWGGTTYDERVIISAMFSSSDVPSDRTSNESLQETRKDSCKHNPKLPQSLGVSIPPLELTLPRLQESRSRSLSEREVAPIAVEFSVPALTLRFG